MTTVLRVRRKRITDPAESLVFSCSKKARTEVQVAEVGVGTASKSPGTADEAAAGASKKVFRFAGTVGRKDEPIAKQIEEAIKKSTSQPIVTSSKPTQSSAKPKSKSSKSKSKSRKKSRTAQQELSQARRYQVVSGHRGIDLNELDAAPSETASPTKKTAPVKRTPSKLKIWNRLTSHQKKAATTVEAAEDHEAKKLFCLYDVVQDSSVATTNGQSQAKSPEKTKDPSNPDVILCNSVQMVREKLVIDDKTQETDYVYDLYYIEEGQLDLDPSSPGGGTGGGAEMLYEHLVAEMQEEEQENYEGDSDSNDEGNWRNDYPEDEPDKRHPDLFDELIDDYCYGDQSSDDDFGEYAESKKRAGSKNFNYNAHGGSGDDLDCYS